MFSPTVTTVLVLSGRNNSKRTLLLHFSPLLDIEQVTFTFFLSLIVRFFFSLFSCLLPLSFASHAMHLLSSHRLRSRFIFPSLSLSCSLFRLSVPCVRETTNAMLLSMAPGEEERGRDAHTLLQLLLRFSDSVCVPVSCCLFFSSSPLSLSVVPAAFAFVNNWINWS